MANSDFNAKLFGITLIAASMVLLLIALFGCSTPSVDVQPRCLPERSYTADQQRALAAAILALPPDSILISVLADYEAMRKADEACRGVVS